MDYENLNADVNDILDKHFTSGRGGNNILYVVIHYNDGDLTTEGCYSVWQTREASAHYQVESSGRIGQLVWDKDTAWHASNFAANQRSIGIEHANQGDSMTDECIENGAHLCAAICKYYELGRPEWLQNVYPHCYFASTSCPGPLMEGTEYNIRYMERAQYWYDVMTGNATEDDSLVDTIVPEEDVDTVYRLYNKASNLHMFTASHCEAQHLADLGWDYEGVAWHNGSRESIYRLYNPYSGGHLLTCSVSEVGSCVIQGWSYEGTLGQKGDAVYRLYNGEDHMYTTDPNEKNVLTNAGWSDEGLL